MTNHSLVESHDSQNGDAILSRFLSLLHIFIFADDDETAIGFSCIITMNKKTVISKLRGNTGNLTDSTTRCGIIIIMMLLVDDNGKFFMNLSCRCIVPSDVHAEAAIRIHFHGLFHSQSSALCLGL